MNNLFTLLNDGHNPFDPFIKGAVYRPMHQYGRGGLGYHPMRMIKGGSGTSTEIVVKPKNEISTITPRHQTTEDIITPNTQDVLDYLKNEENVIDTTASKPKAKKTAPKPKVERITGIEAVLANAQAKKEAKEKKEAEKKAKKEAEKKEELEAVNKRIAERQVANRYGRFADALHNREILDLMRALSKSKHQTEEKNMKIQTALKREIPEIMSDIKMITDMTKTSPLVKSAGNKMFNTFYKMYELEEGNGKAFEYLDVNDEVISAPYRQQFNDYTVIESLEDLTKDAIDPDGSERIRILGWYTNMMKELYKNKKEELDKIKIYESAFKNIEDEKIKIVTATRFIKEYAEILRKYKIYKDKIGLLPWETIPIDLTSKKNLIECKNYIDTGYGESVTIDNKKYISIQTLKNLGHSPEEIERIYMRENKKIPTIPITVGKLTGMTKTGVINPQQIVYNRNTKTGELYAEKMKLGKGKEYHFSPENGYVQQPKVIYDMLASNARIFYSPLDDSNAELKDGHIILPYEKDKDGKNYLVPYTRIIIIHIDI